ncbi:type III secretion system inner membrane ring lipoprotein SctJ [Chlamydiifrater phoenicopteri]|uniref:type III secretion system inner membrane ring lipoprotein SctJ n=1 Tax=Chlamydiifrater phoenicopteri TaxID=2681469 RepID=UPI001BCB33E6|nr:type III secretion inner membrane ring lipoprotein SctJ [Chlamydiifrater phoenicopteri]
MFRRFISFFSLFVLLGTMTGCDSRSFIAHNLPGREANEIVVLLVSKGIAAQKQPKAAGSSGGGSTEQLWDISVPASQITEALSILNQAGLPRLKGTSLLDLFAKQGLVPSELQEKIRYQEGLSEQMATTIRKMDGIIDASVQISFSTDAEEELPLTASVYIKHRGVLDNPNSIVVSKIKRLVASAVPGLTPENVSVIGDRASYSEISINGPWGLTDEIDYVSVWGIILAKSSLVKFRVIFYCMILVLFLISCGFMWLVWKTHAVIGALGGVKSLLDPSPYVKPKEVIAEKATEPSSSAAQGEGSSPASGEEKSAEESPEGSGKEEAPTEPSDDNNEDA